MQLLLTSGGVTNAAIEGALVEMLGRPIAECQALAVPTAAYGQTYVDPTGVWRFVAGRSPNRMVDLGWSSVGVVELTALPSIDRERWERWVRETDVLLVNGGDALYLAYWMRESGLADLLPALERTVWVGLSAGSMVMTPRIGQEFVGWRPPEGGDRTLGIVDFSIFPHLDYPGFDENTMACAEAWATRIDGPAYAIDDDTAITVVGGKVDVVTEGHWRYFPGHDVAQPTS